MTGNDGRCRDSDGDTDIESLECIVSVLCSVWCSVFSV